MSTHYQVNSEFTLKHGKPSLISISYNRTTSAVTTFPVHSEFSLLQTYRIFSTLQEAEIYICFLQCVYKNNKIQTPVLDSGQKNIF